jgi:hypothetical protein
MNKISDEGGNNGSSIAYRDLTDTVKVKADFLILDGEIKVLKEAANNMKSHIDKVEERITYMERLKMADSSSDTAKDLLAKMGS